MKEPHVRKLCFVVRVKEKGRAGHQGSVWVKLAMDETASPTDCELGAQETRNVRKHEQYHNYSPVHATVWAATDATSGSVHYLIGNFLNI